MTTYTVEKVPNEAIVISKALPEWNAANYFEPFVEDLLQVLDDADDSELWYIADLRDWKPDFADILLAAKGLDSDIFGHVPVSVYDSVEAALTHVRSLEPTKNPERVP